jgi:GT2 family glycosyltransferase
VARNIGVDRARTPFVAFADDDSAWVPGALARAALHLRSYPRLALVAARTLVGERRERDPISAAMAAGPLGRDPDLPGPNVLGFLACASVVRRAAFQQAGGFDPVVFFMGEEERLAYDLVRLGWGLSYCDDVVALHAPDPVSKPSRVALAERNRALTAWMRRPPHVVMRTTVALLRRAPSDRYALAASASLMARLPAALARRRRPDPRVEAALHALGTA